MGDPGVRLRHARRRLLDRVEHHAAEEEPRHRRAGARQGRPADRRPRRAAGDAEGAAARVQPGPPGGQGAGLRRGRHARGAAARRSPGMVAHPAFDTERMAARLRREDMRSPPTSRSGWSARACRSARPTRWPVPASGCATSEASSSGSSRRRARRDLAVADAGRPDGAHGRGLDRVAIGRGGTAPERVRRTARELRARLADLGVSSSDAAVDGSSRTVSRHGADPRRDRGVLRPPSRRCRSRPPRQPDLVRGSDGRADRGRGLFRTRRPGVALVSRSDDAQSGDVRPTRSRLRLLHLRHALGGQPGLSA